MLQLCCAVCLFLAAAVNVLYCGMQRAVVRQRDNCVRLFAGGAWGRPLGGGSPSGCLPGRRVGRRCHLTAGWTSCLSHSLRAHAGSGYSHEPGPAVPSYAGSHHSGFEPGATSSCSCSPATATGGPAGCRCRRCGGCGCRSGRDPKHAVICRGRDPVVCCVSWPG